MSNGQPHQSYPITLTGKQTPREFDPVVATYKKGWAGPILTGIAIIILVSYVMISQIFAWTEVSRVRSDFGDLKELTVEDNAQDACEALYRNDVQTAIGLAVAANNNLFVAVTEMPQETPEEERVAAAALPALGEQLKEATQPLILASQALDKYTKMEPKPTQCMHPNADNDNINEFNRDERE